MQNMGDLGKHIVLIHKTAFPEALMVEYPDGTGCTIMAVGFWKLWFKKRMFPTSDTCTTIPQFSPDIFCETELKL